MIWVTLVESDVAEDASVFLTYAIVVSRGRGWLISSASVPELVLFKHMALLLVHDAEALIRISGRMWFG